MTVRSPRGSALSEGDDDWLGPRTEVTAARDRVAEAPTISAPARSAARPRATLAPPNGPIRAARYAAYGDPTVLKIEIVPLPVPGPNDVVVQVAACALSGIDIADRAGELRLTRPALPHGTGFDFAGRVVGTGRQVRRLRYGDTVFGALPLHDTQGACSERVAIDQRRVTLVPAGVTLEQAAALVSSGCAALRAMSRLAPRGRALILGAATSTGFLAAQLAAARGAFCQLVCSPVDYAALCADAPVLERHSERVELDAVAPASVDVILCAVEIGGALALTERLRPGGRLYSASLAAPRTLDQHRELLPLLAEPSAAQLEVLGAFAGDGSLVPPRTLRYTLDDIARAHQAVAAASALGKVVVVL